MIEQIITKGRQLQYSSKQISDEVTAKAIDKISMCFINSESSFNGLNDVLAFRSFLEKSLSDASTEGQPILEIKK